jgi:hypothetical protein
MAKNKSLKKYDDEPFDLHYVEDVSSPNDEAISGMMVGLVEASNHQQKMAIELTKLVVEKSPEAMDEEKVFSSFKRASKVVTEYFPLKELWEKFS